MIVGPSNSGHYQANYTYDLLSAPIKVFVTINAKSHGPLSRVEVV